MTTQESNQSAMVFVDPETKRLTPNQRILRRFVKHRLAVVSVFVLLIMVILAIGAPVFTTFDPNAIDARNLRKPPSAVHILGTDEIGRDVWSRLIYGGRISLAVELVAAGISVTIGTLLGLTSGFAGGSFAFNTGAFTRQSPGCTPPCARVPPRSAAASHSCRRRAHGRSGRQSGSPRRAR